MSSDRVWFVAERFEALRDILLARGYAPDPGPRDPNQWDEQAREDPPMGLVRLKSVRLADPTDDDSDFDPNIAFTIEEWWTPEYVNDATQEQGLFLGEYTYAGHYRGTNVRWDFDPEGHPERPYHFHPPEDENDRRPAELLTPEEALDQFESWIETQQD